MPTHNYGMYSGEGASRRRAPAINVRQEWTNNLRAGMAQSLAGGGKDRPYPGAPPRSGRSPQGSASNYLKRTVGNLAAPHEARAAVRRQTRGGGVRQPDWTSKLEVLDPDELTAEIFSLKKTVLAHETQRKLLKTEIQRLERDNSKLEEIVKEQGDELMSGGPGGSTSVLPGGSSATDVRGQTHLIVNLKQTIRGLRRELDVARTQREDLETSMRHTDMEELALVAKANFEEVQRLQLLLQSGGDGEGADDGEEDFEIAGTGVKPTVQAFQRLENENRWLKEENAELQSDLTQAIEAAQILTGKLRAPPVAPGDAEKYEGMERPQLLKKLLEEESRVVMLQAEIAGLREKVAENEASEDAAARKVGLKSMKEAQELKEAVASLRHENQRLLREAEAAVYDSSTMPMPVQASSGPAVSSTGPNRHTAPAAVVNASAQRQPPSETAAAGLLDSLRQTTHTHDKDPKDGSVVYQTYRPDGEPDGNATQPLGTSQSTPRDPGPPTATLRMSQVLEPPTVSDSMAATTEAGKRIEQKSVAAATAKRKKWLQENKAAVDSAITQIQSALRGHAARRAIDNRIRLENRQPLMSTLQLSTDGTELD